MDLKPEVDAARVRTLLREHFAGDVADVLSLPGGAFSSAFAFTAGGLAYVIRLSAAPQAAESFAKDDYAWRHFASAALPIPRIVATGPTADGHFAIGERIPGRTLEELSPGERQPLLPATLDTLDAITRADLSASHGYGDWGSDGNGRFASWRDYLAAIVENEAEGFYQGWHALFRESFLERDVYEVVYRQLLQLVRHCPEARALLHNDYWFENILADGGRVTGVIDWGNALYGDPLYDVARLAWGSDGPGWWFDDGAAVLHALYGAAPRYAERIACYQCHLGLDDLRYYAKTGRRAEYERARDKLLALDAAGSDGTAA